MVEATVQLPAGLEALAAGRWEDAREALEETAALADGVHRAEAYDGLAEALWWLGRSADAAAARERAFVLYHQRGNRGAAARIAAWLSREYGGPLGNAAAARGWVGRAESLAADGDDVDPCAAGWVALARAGQSEDRTGQAEHARTAVERAREAADRDLEILALARLGLAQIGGGDVDEGVAKLDEAMASAIAGEAERLSTVAEVYCQLVMAADMLGDSTAFAEWSQLLAQMSKQRGLPILMEFCDCCRAEVSAGMGDAHGAEEHFRRALTALERAGQRARCVSPAQKLADLWISQGRLAEAERVLGQIDADDALLPRARLALARGDHRLARALADRFARRNHDDVLACAEALGVLADGAFVAGDLESVRAAVGRLVELADPSAHPRLSGLTLFMRARLAAATDLNAEAIALLEQAIDALVRLPSSIETGRARLELARLYADAEPTLALVEVKAAMRVFDALGASREADRAAALLRSLGDHSRVGAKGNGAALSARERDVLQLLAQGLSNAEIGRRLFISTKTVGNHVSNIFTKRGLRNRAEAAAYALLHAENGEAG